jgi:hypothetical protein
MGLTTFCQPFDLMKFSKRQECENILWVNVPTMLFRLAFQPEVLDGAGPETAFNSDETGQQVFLVEEPVLLKARVA